MKQILEDREDFVFFIKLLPLKIHPAAYKKSKVIACEKSIRLLERAFDGKTIPSEPRCETTEVDDTIELAERLGITGTPTVVLPDGAVIGGFKQAIELVDLVVNASMALDEERALEAEETEREAGGEVIEGEGEEPEGEEEEPTDDAEPADDTEPADEEQDSEGELTGETAPAEEIEIEIKKVQ
jgi:hypothetical protein